MTALKNIPSLIGGAAVLAAAIIGVTTAIASAEWDIDKYDTCMGKTIRNPYSCCVESGGEFDENFGCVAPASMTQVPPEPVPPQIANPKMG